MYQAKRVSLGLLFASTSLACLTMTSTTFAQEKAVEDTPETASPSAVTIQLPLLNLPVVGRTFSRTQMQVPDGGVMMSGFRLQPKRLTVKQLLAQFENKTPPETYRYFFNGKKYTADTVTYDIIHNFQPLKIVTHESGKIQMHLVRHYNDENLDELADDHPEVAMHINGLPDNLSEYANVKLRLDIESNITVDSLAELATKHPSLHLIYQRWVKKPQK